MHDTRAIARSCGRGFRQLYLRPADSSSNQWRQLPLCWSPARALAFLKDVPASESAGSGRAYAGSWSKNRLAHPPVRVTVGIKTPPQVGMDALLDFQMEVTLEGETHSKAEMKRPLDQSEGLAFMCGKWVEVDYDRLTRTLEQYEAIDAAPPMKACRSARPCVRCPVPALPVMELQVRPPRVEGRGIAVAGGP